MSGWRKRQIEQKMYESGLVADGSFDAMDKYDQEAIEKYGVLLVEQALNDVLAIIDNRRNYNQAVYTSYDRGVADAMAQQLSRTIREYFGLSRASGHLSDKGYQLGTEAELQKFVEARNGK